MERETLQKKGLKTIKICGGAKSKSERERERERELEKTFEKALLKKSRSMFKKLDSRCSIDRKTGSINQTRQRLTKNFKKGFD